VRSLPIETATVHSLAWLGVASGVGLLMSLLLLVPRLGVFLGPLTFGRWMPLHLNLVLYGWLALPLVGLLFRAYLPREGDGLWAEWAVQVWSASLVVGAAAWLAGQSSGKLFLDWQGVARIFFLGNLLFLAGVLAHGLLRRKSEGLPRTTSVGLWAFWALLLTVPVAMGFATSPKTYPPINPDTGGPTGASLLGSTLCVIVIFAGTPLLLGLRRRTPLKRAAWEVFGALALHTAFFVAVGYLGHGDRSHHEPLQIAAVASLLVWAWLLPRWLRRFEWPAGSRAWLWAFLAWGGALLASAVPMFLPGLLDRIKFTNALVGHAHLAMAGMATSFAALLLVVLNLDTRLHGLLGDRAAFVLWNGGNVVHVAALVAAGVLEAQDAGILFRGAPAITALYALRSAAGACMLAAAVRWIGSGVRRRA
jgi:cytochrome c oxidase cbb3-type subunit 1